jgi:formate hydrogenlyase transcriptional activator
LAAFARSHFSEEGGRERRLEQIIGNSRALQSVLEQIECVASTDSTVLVLGETGTGKELIARAIHNLSLRCGRPFITLNCASIPFDLLESELFGHEKGAFTGAIAQRVGRFETADKGTLFLDEIGDMPLALQPKLLRVLQEQEFERLGSTHTRRVDVRVVAATNQDLAGRVAQKQFRSDLYYRLNVFPIAVPPLRERLEDIPMLVVYFVQKFGQRMSKQISKVPNDAMDALMRYPWPGNIRELQNIIERAVILTDGDVLQIPPLPQHATLNEAGGAKMGGYAERQVSGSLTGTLEEAERDHVLKALKEANWVVGGTSGAAAHLGLARTTLISKMRKLGISRSHDAESSYSVTAT